MEIHILNGDALKAQFPESLSGERIVMRECLVDGKPEGRSLEALFDHRMNFLATAYGVAPEQYRSKTISEIERIKNLVGDAKVHLWFEDDLFCQVNLWFTAHLLQGHTPVRECTLVRPTGDLRYGFGGMDRTALEVAFEQRQLLDSQALGVLATLWSLYQERDHAGMASIAEQQCHQLPFLRAAVQAEYDRYPDQRGPGRPERTLSKIMTELGSEQFGPIFREFSERESIYGYGDLQVRRLFDELRAKA